MGNLPISKAIPLAVFGSIFDSNSIKFTTLYHVGLHGWIVGNARLLYDDYEYDKYEYVLVVDLVYVTEIVGLGG